MFERNEINDSHSIPNQQPERIQASKWNTVNSWSSFGVGSQCMTIKLKSEEIASGTPCTIVGTRDGTRPIRSSGMQYDAICKVMCMIVAMELLFRGLPPRGFSRLKAHDQEII